MARIRKHIAHLQKQVNTEAPNVHWLNSIYANSSAYLLKMLMMLMRSWV